MISHKDVMAEGLNRMHPPQHTHTQTLACGSDLSRAAAAAEVLSRDLVMFCNRLIASEPQPKGRTHPRLRLWRIMT